MARRLTFKQRQFAKKYVENGGNGTKTAQQVYNVTTPESASAMAQETLGNPRVQETIEQIANQQGITSGTILGKFASISSREAEKWSGETILKATENLARILRMYPSTKHTVLNVSFKGKLKEMTPADLQRYVEGMRSKNDEMLKEIQEADHPK